MDGVPLVAPKLVYYAVNKPVGVLSTNRDPSGRPRVIDLVPGRDARLFTIGRLDLHSEGLILVTNDGELANRLTHPRYGVGKTYRVVVAGRPTGDILAKLRQGVHLAEGLARAERVEIKSVHKESTRFGNGAARGKEPRDSSRSGPGGAQGGAADADRRRPGAAGQSPRRRLPTSHARGSRRACAARQRSAGVELIFPRPLGEGLGVRAGKDSAKER